MKRSIGIGLIGAGYMGKAHAVALQAVAAVFETPLRPRCEMIATRSTDGAAAAAERLGFARSTGDWRELVADPKVEAVVIASMQDSHREIAEAAFALGKPVFCEKPLAESTESAEAMVEAAERAGVVNMIGFNYVRTPATQFARKLLADGVIGDLHYLRIEHCEDFLADPEIPANWRTKDKSCGNLGDLAPHAVNAALALGGNISELLADVQTVFKERQGEAVGNDDQAHFVCRFASGAMGYLLSTRVAHGRKMGYTYEIHGSKGTIKFDQEDQNTLWLYVDDGEPATAGFKKILTGPAHPDYEPFCLGPAHGTGYQDQIIIEQKDFLHAIATGKNQWPDFRHGLQVHRVIDAAHASHQQRSWVSLADES